MNKVLSSTKSFAGKLCLTLLFWLLTLGFAAAQDYQHDPLGKPDIWKNLVKHPSDMTLWESYIGKQWREMTTEEKKMIAYLSHELKATPKSGASAVISADGSNPSMPSGQVHKKQEEVKQEEKDAFWGVDTAMSKQEEAAQNMQIIAQKEYERDLQEFMLQENPELTELKKNVAGNFFLIEDIFVNEFLQLGVPYKTYLSLYPKETYSKQKWVEEKSAELYKLKKAEYDKMSAQLKKND